MTTPQPIKWFTELDRSSLPVAGGKGANLGELTRAHLSVPPGFVIPTQAYHAFVDGNQLQAQILNLAKTPIHIRTALEDASHKIRELFRQGRIPDNLATAITHAYEQLASAQGPAVAVRSSATAEDLPGASFAGQQETLLNVRAVDALLDAVKECWASLWTARAISYRRRQGIALQSVSMAVVVQTMAPAAVSGILFTANPATGARDELMVEASFGLGEAIVSGAVTPDSYRLDRENMILKETRLGTKDLMIVANADGTEGGEHQNRAGSPSATGRSHAVHGAVARTGRAGSPRGSTLWRHPSGY
jgi:phosphoenolpyruvate synthase/pyruvate phosphate dikinase